MLFLTLAIEILDNRPILSIKVIIAVPPYDIKGSGIPTTGKRPITMAILINTYKNRVVVTPMATNFPNFSLE
jgi:hypothetical protein